MKILHRYTGKILFEIEGGSLRRASLQGTNLRWANLRGANLRGADLRGTNLQEADLQGANLQEADLQEADLQEANLRGAYLRGAYLRGANLQEANLRGAGLQEANLRWTNLRGANLRGASLREANLRWASLPDYIIVPETGGFFAWKALDDKSIAKVYIPASAKRMSSLIGRKCRCSKLKIIKIYNKNGKTINRKPGWRKGVYETGKTYEPDSYDDDIRVECTHGLHFFMTKKEALEW